MTAPSQPPVQWNAAPPAVRPGPTAGLQYAGFWIRVVAYILDAIVLAIIGAALGPIAGSTTVTQTGSSFAVNTTGTGLNLLVSLIYFVAFWAWRGQTPGMIPFNLRVVMADTGLKPDVVRALLRYVGLLISFVVLALGVIWVAFDARKQGWHDKIAGTLVVRPG